MKCLKTYSWGFYALVGLLLVTSCQKEVAVVPSQKLDLADNAFVRDWYALSIELSSKCNGFEEPIVARSLSYLSFTMYETLIQGLDGYQSLQVKLDGFKVTLPQAEAGKKYNWGIVSNEATSLIVHNLYLPAGSNLSLADVLRQKYADKFSLGESQEVINQSIELGKAIGRAIWEFSLTDGQSEAYLNNYPASYTMPSGPGQWIPTSPDYAPRPLLPFWSKARTILNTNVFGINLNKSLIYSEAQNSNIYAEAVEVYNLSEALTLDQKESIGYFNREMDKTANPLSHNFLLALQLVKEQQLNLPKTLELLVCLAFAANDGYISSWKIKYDKNLLRVSSYIRQHLNRFYIPVMGSLPVPEFVSESAVIYSSGAEILSKYLGYRFPFMDYTQKNRTDLRSKVRRFESFIDFAKEASYVDILAGVHFRSSIDAGFDLGNDISRNILNIPFQVKK
ncbi:MAG: hypothetical protein IPI30_05290 [Saprospiraceae bacterium]|nr:hypothetical protein [Candidatus Vicinibacter affinis]HQX43836.1 hypothetical protein [Saprospiraceae bacterium]